MITFHAERRLQQRAIPIFAIELFQRYASSMRHKGAEVLFIDKAARKRLAQALGGKRGFRAIEPWLNAFVCIEDGNVITVAHRSRRLKRDA